MCGLLGEVRVTEHTSIAQPRHGWLEKKSHHLGVWRRRYFRFDGEVLLYWKTLDQAQAKKKPRGTLKLQGCFVIAGPDSRFIIHRAAGKEAHLLGTVQARIAGAFDEELQASSPEERDTWVRALNLGARQLRRQAAAAGEDFTAVKFLHRKGVLGALEEVASAVPSAVAARNGLLQSSLADSLGLLSCASTISSNPFAEELELATSSHSSSNAPDNVLAHACCGRALLRRAEQVLEPRHGLLVVAGRRVLQGIGCREPPTSEGASEVWLLLASVRNLARGGEETLDQLVGPLGAGACAEVDKAASSSPVAFEALHAYANAGDESSPVASLPLLGCEVSAVEKCADGGGWVVQVGPAADAEEEKDVEEDKEFAARAQRHVPPWTIIVETRDECEAWHRALVASCWAARAKAAGCWRLAEEALAVFTKDPAGWKDAAARCVTQAESAPAPDSLASSLLAGFSTADNAAGAVAGLSPSTSSTVPGGAAAANARASLRRAIRFCDILCREAEDMLEAARAKQPPRLDAVEAAVKAALEPSLRCICGLWTRFSDQLSQTDGRLLLRWLETRRRAALRLHVVRPTFRALDELAAELALRAGEQLAKMTVRLLVWEFGEALQMRFLADSEPSASSTDVARGAGAVLRPPPSPLAVGLDSGSRSMVAGSGSLGEMGGVRRANSAGPHRVTEVENRVVSTLPVDLFTYVWSCLPLDDEEDVIELRLNARRVAKFVLQQVQVALRSWLEETHLEALEDSKGNHSVAGPAGQKVLSRRVQRWLCGVAALLNSIPMLAAKCRELGDSPLLPGPDHAGAGQDPSVEGGRDGTSRLGPQALPADCDLTPEAQWFEAFAEVLTAVQQCHQGGGGRPSVTELLGNMTSTEARALARVADSRLSPTPGATAWASPVREQPARGRARGMPALSLFGRASKQTAATSASGAVGRPASADAATRRRDQDRGASEGPGMAAAAASAAQGILGYPTELTPQVLEQRLGGLWPEVRARLQARATSNQSGGPGQRGHGADWSRLPRPFRG